MNNKIKDAVEQYQCLGCVCGNNIECYEKSDYSIACGRHVVGTHISYIGRVFLGLPKGFNRVGLIDNMPIYIFNKLIDGWDYNKYNVPVWKFLNDNGHTLVRGISPRGNMPFLHIYLEDCMSSIDCIEITQADIDEMD